MTLEIPTLELGNHLHCSCENIIFTGTKLPKGHFPQIPRPELKMINSKDAAITQSGSGQILILI